MSVDHQSRGLKSHSQWFINHRQQFIADALRIFGQVNRSSLVKQFDISMPQAANDIALFLRRNPEVLVYDGRTKCYVVNTDALPPPPQEPTDG